ALRSRGSSNSRARGRDSAAWSFAAAGEEALERRGAGLDIPLSTVPHQVRTGRKAAQKVATTRVEIS
ncbi:MAG TPA: hypothetical protein VM937_08900, partial [Burkholderiaceae bacterium]|nr:hypothetical protein [Burkholderiaceae bacterium]